ncbi:MAG: hypothetical protein JKY65_01835 [Planctomycetes bacterium]|nr:hypothetical protein [Planctomycetota bacterium]
MLPPSTSSPSAAPSRLPTLCVALLFLLHGILAVVLLWPMLVEGKPGDWLDHPVHCFRFSADARLVEEIGTTRGYDPKVVAGYPHGAVDLDSPLAASLGRFLTPVLGPIRAYALWGLGVTLLIPLALGGLARARGSPAQGLAVVALSVVALQLDPLLRHMVRGGTYAWLLGSLVLVVFAGLFASGLERPRPRTQAALTVLALGYGAHVLAPPVVALLFLALTARRISAGGPGLARSLRFAATTAGIGLLLNAPWLIPLALHVDQAGLPVGALAPRNQLVPDLLSLVVPGRGYQGSMLGLRWGLWLLGVVACLGARPRNGRPAPLRRLEVGLLAAIAVALVLTYLPLDALRRLQPYRLVVLAIFAALVVAPEGVRKAWAWTRSAQSRRLVGIIGMTLICVSLAIEGKRMVDAPLRSNRLGPDGWRAIELLQARPGQGRVLAELIPSDKLAQVLPSVLSRQTLTFKDAAQPNLAAIWSVHPPFFLGRPLAEVRPEEIPGLLDRYAVEWVVATSKHGHALLDHVASGYFAEVLDAGHYRLYRVARPTGWIASGQGKVEARSGRLLLKDLSGPVVLRFHHAPGLEALEPGVRIERVPIPGDPSGFIRVDPGDRSEVELRWNWWRRFR